VQPESAHISSDLPQCFSIDPTDASVGPLSVGVQTQAEGLFMHQGWKPEGPRPEGAWFTTARSDAHKNLRPQPKNKRSKPKIFWKS